MNTQPNWDALQQLHNKLSEIRPDIKMLNYLSYAKNDCATSCCLAGWGIEFKIATIPEIDEQWAAVKRGIDTVEFYKSTAIGRQYVNLLLGDNFPDNTKQYLDNQFGTTSEPNILFRWLFSGIWNNNLDMGLLRLNYTIQTKSVPAVYSYKSYSSVSMTELLNKFGSIKLEYIWSSSQRISRSKNSVLLPILMPNHFMDKLNKMKRFPECDIMDVMCYVIPKEIRQEVLDYLHSNKVNFYPG